MTDSQAVSALRTAAVLAALGILLSAGPAAAQGRRNSPYQQGQPRTYGQIRPGRPLPPVQPQPVIPAYMRVRVEDDQVTATVRATPLQQVLQEIADRSGLVFEVQSQDNPPISISLFRVGLQEAIQRIVASDNSIFYYGNDVANRSRIEFVRVFPRTNQPQQPSLVYIGTGAVTKSGNDTVDTPEDALKVLIDSQNVEARQKAIEVLVAEKGDLATLALTAALLDPAPEVRAAAIEGLASLGAQSALPGIIQALKDKHPGVRQSAITAVALLGDAENIKNLRPLSKDRDVSVAAAAEVAIRKLSSTRRP